MTNPSALESVPFPQPTMEVIADPMTFAGSIVVLGVSESGALSRSGEAFDRRCGGWIRRLIDVQGFSGKKGKTAMVPLADTPAGEHASGPTVAMLIGLGEAELPGHAAADKPMRAAAIEIAATAIRGLTDQARAGVLITLAEWFTGDDADAIVAGVLTGCEYQSLYHTEPSTHVPQSIGFTAVDQAMLDQGVAIGRGINLTRRLVNEPASVIYPASFADRVVELAAGTSLEVEVWDQRRLQSEGCRAMLAVGQGSIHPPRLVMIRHRGGDPSSAALAVVGKGVTFDSGGLSIKPSDGMVDMKCDMAGAATVVGLMTILDALKVPVNVIGYCGLAENMISGASYKLGDVIETRSGQTIEILNTDAEGRVVLADTLDVAIQHEPAAMVDLATLTGACMVALGMEVAGMMTNNDGLCREIRDAAAAEGEPVWELPMFPLYDDKIKSKVADIKNVGEGRWGGAITAAKFLEKFVGDTPWVHLDIAGPAFADTAKPHRDAGGTGVMVRTLLRWIRSRG